METIQRPNSSSDDFKELVAALDAELAERDGKDHSFYDQFNKIDKIKYAVVFYHEDIPVACGAMKQHDNDSMEVKRMYTRLDFRGKGLATKTLVELENWARELGFTKCILETGKRQPEAIALYKKNNYSIVQNYGQYVGIENSVCFEKIL